MNANKDDAPIRVRKQSFNGRHSLGTHRRCGVTTSAFLESGYVEIKPIMTVPPAADENPPESENQQEARPMEIKAAADKKATAPAELLSNTKERQTID